MSAFAPSHGPTRIVRPTVDGVAIAVDQTAPVLRLVNAGADIVWVAIGTDLKPGDAGRQQDAAPGLPILGGGELLLLKGVGANSLVAYVSFVGCDTALIVTAGEMW